VLDGLVDRGSGTRKKCAERVFASDDNKKNETED